MSSKITKRLIRFAPLAALFCAAGVAAGNVSAGTGAASEGSRCEIVTRHAGAMIAIDAQASGPRGATGTYSFQIAGSGGGGSTNIRQGGEFSFGSSAPKTLGSVTLGANGGVYDATLTIDSGGVRTSCTRRIGGRV